MREVLREASISSEVRRATEGGSMTEATEYRPTTPGEISFTDLITLAKQCRSIVNERFHLTGDEQVGREFRFKTGYILNMDVEIVFRVREAEPLPVIARSLALPKEPKSRPCAICGKLMGVDYYPPGQAACARCLEPKEGE
jgi:hypothetical protein